jgi:predicted nucleotidyltransferase
MVTSRGVSSATARKEERPLSCLGELTKHPALNGRRSRSAESLQRVRQRFGNSEFLSGLPLAVFCAGSLARQEVGKKSDLDIFVTADSDRRLQSRLGEYSVIAELIHLNRELGFDEFSNDGQYLKIYFVDDLTRKTGSPTDDSENSFTTRMLMVLESEPLLHDERYERHVANVLEHYYRDHVGKKSFRPLFLLNDLLRYWRTLCLNYEERREDPSKPWRKKNVNLKFSRMVTVFGTVLPLVLNPAATAEDFVPLCRKRPLERLAGAIDRLEDARLNSEWPRILDIYEEFLEWKELDDVEEALQRGTLRESVRRNAEQLSMFLYSALTHDRIRPEFRRYLTL